jgi:hypothetical protein
MACVLLKLARSLITKELPIKIRLLGIRMTHLKDMRAADTGIQKVCLSKGSMPSLN